MKLKKLEIAGFKSFRDKVLLEFPQGICSIIGPNGCGKSNIADAIRWVMGEQRVKTLRGKRMDDVIFNGSEDAPPVGMAEVSMILTNGDQKFPGDYAEFTEVMISRKIYRDGESEYCINKTPCRLLDVREFFMDTGVGTRSYSFVEQNSIADLVEANPEQRRQFIEEAAGISKYKSRKEAAMRKMEATKQNMVRLQDITREIKNQLNALSRQAKRAEEYRDLKMKIKEAELSLALHTFSDFLSKRQALEKSLQGLGSEEINAKTRLEECEANLESLKLDLLDTEKFISDNQEKLYSIKNTINIKEQEIEFTKGKIADTSLRKQKNLAEIDILNGKSEEIDKEIVTVRATDQESVREIRDTINKVEESQKKVDHIKQMELALQRELDIEKNTYIDTVTRRSNLKNLLSTLEKEVEDIKRREDRDGGELDENKNKIETVNRLLDSLSSDLRRDEETIKDLKERKKSLSEEIRRLRDDIEAVDEQILNIKEEVGKKSSRLFSLKEFQEGYGWCNEGTKSIMHARRNDESDALSKNVFMGLVADFIGVPQEYERAVEAVLGEKLQYIVVKSQEDGVRAIDYLKAHSLGRSSFVPFEVRHYLSGTDYSVHLQETVRLIEKVNIEEENFRGIIEYLLGDVLLIQNLQKGIALWRQNGFVGTFVTPEGDIVNANGVLTGGSSVYEERSLLRNKREITEIEKEVKNLDELLRENINQKRELSIELSRQDDELMQVVSELHDMELQINSKKKDVERIEGERKQIEQRIKIIDFNRENIKIEQEEVKGKIAAINDEILSYENKEKLINETITSLQEKCQALRTELDEAEKNLTINKVLLASLDEKKKANLVILEKLEASWQDMSRDLALKRQEVDVYNTQAEEMAQRMSDNQKSLEILYKDHDIVEAALTQKRLLQEEKQVAFRGLESEFREVKKLLDEKLKDTSEVEMERRELNLEMENLRKGMQTKYNLDLCILIEDFKVQDEASINELYENVAKNREIIENFGEVNLLALSEYEQLKERHEFMATQLADVNTSLNSLQQTISRINKISRSRFLETFNAVNLCFQEVFTKVFRGGKASLRLTDEADLLETGVDIDIQIPGKRAQNISLLSGGEKSLAAIALIFAIIMYRPSPFLILDEVDAALDDSNVVLFNQLIKDISTNSQIIMVTHNKKTMEVSSNLYGVTMQKKGISSLVSVNLN